MSARLLINFPILEGLRYLLDRAIAQDIHRYQVGARQLNLFSDNRFLTTIFPFRLPRQDLRRILRYRNFLVYEAIRMKNKTSGLLMEVGAEYNKSRLHGAKYFQELLANLDYVPESVLNLLQITRSNLESFTMMQKSLIRALRSDPQIKQRAEKLMTIQGVGEVTALTWMLEIGDVHRFGRISRAISYCGLCSAQKQSAGKNYRGPISKKRNKHLQTVLIEAAKLAPRWNPQLAEVHERELAKGHRNRATLAVTAS